MDPRVPVGGGRLALLEVEQGIQAGAETSKLAGANVPMVRRPSLTAWVTKLVAGLVAAQRSLGAARFRDVFIGRRQAAAG